MRPVWILGALLLAGCPQTIVVEGRDGGETTQADAGFADSGVRDVGAQIDGDDAGTRDAGSGRDGGPGRDAGRDGGADTCFVDPFDACPDPDEAGGANNEWHTASAIHSSSAGCQTGDDFEPLDASARSVLCHVEPADFYRLTIVPCDTRTMIATLRLTVHDTCPDDRYHLAWFSGGGRLDCNDPQDGLTCTRDGEDLVIRRRVDPGNSLLSWQFAVESDFEDVRFEYTLNVTLE